ncbi:alpha/beta fold hydrolase [Roseibium sp. AS2]|uniref:PHA/PHB synthase family protein n=1 Tax=Roseibium sp. AS2 TaxID=3135781 RepID=UPI003173FF35
MVPHAEKKSVAVAGSSAKAKSGRTVTMTGPAGFWPDEKLFPRLPSPAFLENDSYTSNALAEVLNRATHASFAKVTKGLSPTSLIAAYFDWLIHLACAPGKQVQLSEKAIRKLVRLQHFMLECAASQGHADACIEPLPQDRRFQAEAWQQWPFNVLYQSHLLAQQWWHVATTGVPGVSSHHERVLEFTARQLLDVFAPSNYVATNPEILARTLAEGGLNFVRGFQNFLEDWQNEAGGKPPAGAEKFRPGQEVAATPGKVVYRNRLIELIQYTPTTETVRPEPVLIVPAWINKYYILDLSPHNSMIRYLVGKGYTVFAISWKNPDPGDRDLGMDDYGNLGIIAALNAIAAIVPDEEVHGVGYCLGGTLLAIAASAMARKPRQPFRSLSFFAAQIDFEDPGELQLFIDESQVQFLEDMMWEQGFLDSKQMSGAFQLLRSSDLFWSSNMRKYLLGERPGMIDLIAWNADSTRMPYRMHSEYLRSLYLNNDLAEGRFEVDGHPVTISDIRVPLFCVGTDRDHVAPWRSVYNWNRMTDTEVTFVLTNGGHNAGVVSEPAHHNRHYQIATRQHDDLYTDPDTWAATTPSREGSWWTAWTDWLDAHSGEAVAPPPMGNAEAGYVPIIDAPGTYVFLK